MKPAPFDHVAPQTLEEALELLTRHGEEAKLLAGGQSLVPILALRLAAPAWLIDINRIGSLAGIAVADTSELAIGALTRHSAVEKSDIVAARNPLLAAAVPWIAHIAIRNRGTIGGSLAHADPAAELPAVCVACDASIIARSRKGARRVNATDFFKGLFDTALRPDEILTEIRFPSWPANRTHGFLEISRRHGDFALCGIAATIDRSTTGRIEGSRIVAFGVTDRPVRLLEAERALTGTDGNEGVKAAAAAAVVGLSPRSDLHASSDYRRELTEVLTRRTLNQALSQQREAKPA